MRPTVVELTGHPACANAAASCARLLHVQRNGEVGSPRVSGSTTGRERDARRPRHGVRPGGRAGSVDSDAPRQGGVRVRWMHHRTPAPAGPWCASRVSTIRRAGPRPDESLPRSSTTEVSCSRLHRDQHGPPESPVVRFYNKRGTAEQWIKDRQAGDSQDIAAVADAPRLGGRPHPATPFVQHRCHRGILRDHGGLGISGAGVDVSLHPMSRREAS